MLPRRQVISLIALLAFLTLTGVTYNLSAVMTYTNSHRQMNRMESHLKLWHVRRSEARLSESIRFKDEIAARIVQHRQEEEDAIKNANSNTESSQSIASSESLMKIRQAHQEELLTLQVEHNLKFERIDESLSEEIASTVEKGHIAEGKGDSYSLGRKERSKRASGLLQWFCQLPQPEIQELVEGPNGTLASFGKAKGASCLDGDQGVPVAPLPPADEDWKHMIFTKFESAVISRSVAALARWHIGQATRNKLDTGIGSAQAKAAGSSLVFPDSDVYRGSVVMLHPWLGVFYRVRVPVSVTDSHSRESGGTETSKGSHDSFSYRQECFRRPWAYFSEDGFGVKLESTGDSNIEDPTSAIASAKSLRNRPHSLKDDVRAPILHAILMMHQHVRSNTVISLIHDMRKHMGRSQMPVALTVVPCTEKGCAEISLIEKELQKIGDNKFVDISIPGATTASSGEDTASDPWNTWHMTLLNVLKNSVHGADVPVVLLDGHTSSLSSTFIQEVLAHTNARRRAVLPISSYFSPTHQWKEVFFNKALRKAQKNAIDTKTKSSVPKSNEDDAMSSAEGESRARENRRAAYTERLVIPLAFSKADGLAALESWSTVEKSFSVDSSVMSGSCVAVCGRVTLAWLLQSNLGMELRRYFVQTPQLHAWDPEKAEAAATKSAIDMLHHANKQHNEYLFRLKNGSNSEVRVGNKQQNKLMPNSQINAAAFFPDNMSPTMVTPELPTRGASQVCDLALDALGLCDTCSSDIRALTTVDVSREEHGDSGTLSCSTVLGADSTSWAKASNGLPRERAVFRSFSPLHGIVHDTEHPVHKYVHSLGQPDIFV